jgi:DNA-binding MarR family transcriptional regulator
MGRIKASAPKYSAGEPEQVFESIHAIMHLVRSKQYGVLKNRPIELTHLEGKLLGFFSNHPGASLRDVVEHTGRDKSQLARLIASLKQQGLLEGQDDDYDRRSVRLRLTAEGRAIHRVLRREYGKLSEIAVEDLSREERRELASLLRRVRANLDPSPHSP